MVGNLQIAWGFAKDAMVIVKLAGKTPVNIRKVLASLTPLNIALKSLTRSRHIETLAGLPVPETGNRTLSEFVLFLRQRLQKAGATGYAYIEAWKTASGNIHLAVRRPSNVLVCKNCSAALLTF